MIRALFPVLRLVCTRGFIRWDLFILLTAGSVAIISDFGMWRIADEEPAQRKTKLRVK